MHIDQLVNSQVSTGGNLKATGKVTDGQEDIYIYIFITGEIEQK